MDREDFEKKSNPFLTILSTIDFPGLFELSIFTVEDTHRSNLSV